ncbi:MAG: hypothetical protein IJQ81_16920 [Oscillibacter sp.]|nr:hypothetical protein [Oscillibacter sp.]
MKVQITKDAKKWLTLAEAPVARAIVADFKDPEMYGNERAEELIERAARAYLDATGYCDKIGYVEKALTAKAEIAGNQRVHNYYFADSGRLDVWIQGAVELSRGFLEIHAYLSDIWALGGDEAARNLAAHAYVRRFAECE